jgi:hypothetical protein
VGTRAERPNEPLPNQERRFIELVTKVAVSIQGTHIVYHRPQGGSRSAPPRCAVASESPVSEKEGDDESKSSSEERQAAARRTHHRLDGTNPKLKYMGVSNFDDWNERCRRHGMATTMMRIAAINSTQRCWASFWR